MNDLKILKEVFDWICLLGMFIAIGIIWVNPQVNPKFFVWIYLVVSFIYAHAFRERIEEWLYD